MNRLFRSAWVIARRDYSSTVFSKLFLFFLISPLFPILFGGTFSVIGTHSDTPQGPPTLAVIASPADVKAIARVRSALAERLGDDVLPRIEHIVPQAAPHAEAVRLLRGSVPPDAVLTGPLDHPRFYVLSHGDNGLSDQAALLVDQARALEAHGPPPGTSIELWEVKQPPRANSEDARHIALLGQTGLFVITILLAGMLLSNLIEEKSNKVIEVLAAAVPVDAIFLGKLAGMLALSLTFIAVWSIVLALGATVALPAQFGSLPSPAVGWPVFGVLGVLYFSTSYLLLGAVFLGIGSQASTPREIQIMSMPVTMIQLLLFGFASAGLGDPDGWLAWAAAIFPWSSPLAMLGRAAEEPALWPHLAALVWQALWLALAIRIAAGRFRVAVLKSGGRRKKA